MSSAEIRGRFVWHELMTTDTAAAGAFYPRVAGWTSQPWDHDSSYTLWVSRDGPLGGLMHKPEEAAPSQWMPYLSTEDVDATIETARKLGARVHKEAFDVPNAGRIAILADPQGAVFAIIKPTPPQGASAPKAPPGASDFSWHELATTDAPAALRFYSALFGWGKGTNHDMGEIGYYQIFKLGGKESGGIYKLQPGVTTPHWLSYVRVDDVNKAANAAKAAGGRVINGPMEVPGGDWIAQIIDPQGVAFAVHQVKRAEKLEQPAKQAQKAAAPATVKSTKRASARRPAVKKSASGRKRTRGRVVAKSKRPRIAKRAAAKRVKTTAAGRRRLLAARKRVSARKGTARRRLRAQKKRR